MQFAKFPLDTKKFLLYSWMQIPSLDILGGVTLDHLKQMRNDYYCHIAVTLHYSYIPVDEIGTTVQT